MGMGHVPQDPIHSLSKSSQFQRRQRRRTSTTRSSQHRQSVAASRLARARWAEQLVARWYEKQGFTVIAMNWTMRGGELDVVVRQGSLIVVCEVKARATEEFGSPLEAMTALKQQRVRRAGYAFVRQLGELGVTLRFDIASVLGTQLEIYEDSF